MVNGDINDKAWACMASDTMELVRAILSAQIHLNAAKPIGQNFILYAFLWPSQSPDLKQTACFSVTEYKQKKDPQTSSN